MRVGVKAFLVSIHFLFRYFKCFSAIRSSFYGGTVTGKAREMKFYQNFTSIKKVADKASNFILFYGDVKPYCGEGVYSPN